MNLIARIGIALSLAAQPAMAATKVTTAALGKSQCDRLNELWWGAEGQLRGLRGCRTTRCTQARVDLLIYQSTIAGLWSAGGCDRYYGVRPW